MTNWSGRTQPPRPTSTAAVVLLAAVLLVAIVVAVARAGPPTRVVGHGQIKYNGAGPERWAQRWRREHRLLLAVRAELRRQRRVLLSRPHVVEAVNLSCAVYGSCPTLWRKARCETGGTFDPGARNPGSGAAGLFQFLPSTWRSTPFGVFSVWSPYANALAAGWMHAHGRGNEWSCR
jgi:Transglycosylase-like domain